jgi:hypothetical protein
MTEDLHPDTAGHVAAPPSPRTIAIWAGLVMAVLILIALGLASHKSGVPTVAPGQKAAPATQTALNNIADRLQALPVAHAKAATRQADAKG